MPGWPSKTHLALSLINVNDSLQNLYFLLRLLFVVHKTLIRYSNNTHIERLSIEMAMSIDTQKLFYQKFFFQILSQKFLFTYFRF